MHKALFPCVTALALVVAHAVRAAEFIAAASPGTSNAIGGCLPGTTHSDSPNPVQASITCGSSLGAGSAAAISSFGHVGASASVATITSQTLPGQFGAEAFVRDSVVFTSADPTATTTNVSVNLILDGVLNAAGSAFSGGDAELTGDVRFGGFFQFDYRFFSNGTFTATNPLAVTGTTVAPNFNAGLTTPTVLVSLNTPVLFELQLDVRAESSGAGASATSDFGGSFKFPTGTNVFNLEDGVTANAGDWLVDNRFIDPLAIPAGGVPEPASWALMITGFGLSGAALRRRRPRLA